MKLPKSHPRYESLRKRELILQGMRDGIVAEAGLIAHGRGEAFDYLLGECTHPEAEQAEKVTACYLLLAEHPVISVNGNTAVLVPRDMVELSEVVPAQLEINLFYRTEERAKRIADHLRQFGAKGVLGEDPDAVIPGLDHKRALCSSQGTMKADVILVPLEDGDRTQALKNMGKTVITIDLNPLSRTSKTSHVAIANDVVRSMPNIVTWVRKFKEEGAKRHEMEGEVSNFNNEINLQFILDIIKKKAVFTN